MTPNPMLPAAEPDEIDRLAAVLVIADILDDHPTPQEAA